MRSCEAWNLKINNDMDLAIFLGCLFNVCRVGVAWFRSNRASEGAAGPLNRPDGIKHAIAGIISPRNKATQPRKTFSSNITIFATTHQPHSKNI